MKITDSELEIMKLLWEAKLPVTFSLLRRTLERELGWTNSTVKTLLNRLVEKQAVLQEKRGVYYYSSLVDQRSYSAQVVRSMAGKLSGGSITRLLAGLIEEEVITSKDLEELHALLHDKEVQND